MRTFSLHPYLPLDALPGLAIGGSVSRQAETLAIRFVLQGDRRQLAMPRAVGPPVRRHRLWEKTCFEFFVAPGDAEHYWEVNLSPAGHWNVYRFSGYRQGMQEELAYTALPVAVRKNATSLQLDAALDLARIVSPAQPLRIGISAVIQARVGAHSFCALTHPGPQADFHRRDGFIVEL